MPEGMSPVIVDPAQNTVRRIWPMQKQASAEKHAGGIGRAQDEPLAKSSVEKPIDPQARAAIAQEIQGYKPSRCQIVVVGPAWFMV